MNKTEKKLISRRLGLARFNRKYLSQPILYREVEYIVFGFGKTTRMEAV